MTPEGIMGKPESDLGVEKWATGMFFHEVGVRQSGSIGASNRLHSEMLPVKTVVG